MIGISFHRIGVPSMDFEPETQDYVVTNDIFLATLDEIATRRSVELSFDDGYASDVEIALPALLERGLKATFFPLAGRLGHQGYVDSAGLRALSLAGMTVGSHGMNHRSWRHLDDQAKHQEFLVAREAIAAAAGAPVTSVACPFGAYDRTVLRALRHCGYSAVFTSDRRPSRQGAWLQPRYTILRADTIQTIRADILSRPPVSEQLRRACAVQVKAWR